MLGNSKVLSYDQRWATATLLNPKFGVTFRQRSHAKIDIMLFAA